MSWSQEASTPHSDARAKRRAGWHLVRPTLEFYSWLDRRRGFRPMMLVVVAVLSGLLLTADPLGHDAPAERAAEGTVASQNVKAPYDLDIVDDASSTRLREEAATAQRRVYDFDVSLAAKKAARIATAFGWMRSELDEAPAPHGRWEDYVASRRAEFIKMLGTQVSPAAWERLKSAHFSEAAETALADFVSAAQAQALVEEPQALRAEHGRGLLLQRVPSDGKPHQVVDTVEAIGDVESSRLSLTTRTANLHSELGAPLRAELVQLAGQMLEANVSFNRAETERARGEAQKSVKAVSLAVKKGEMIIRDGERLTHRHLLILDALQQNRRGSSFWLVALGGAALLGVLVVTGSHFARSYGRRRWGLSARDLLFLATVFLLGLAAMRFWLFAVHQLHDNYPNIVQEALLLAAPFAAGTMLVRLVLRAEVALLFSLIASLMLGLFADGTRLLSVYALIGSVVATSAIRTISSRSDLLRAGVWVGLAQSATALAMFLLGANTCLRTYVMAVPAAFFGGALCGFVALSLTPLFEWAFNYTTDLKLLELSNLNHPALKELIVQAPGSYHHSIIVGALVEAAAESIGANPLLGRVMAYYHDLGKGCNPVYFVENQRTGHNPHDKLKPSMSAMIIRRHVTDGIELAKRHGLGEQILAGIAQHHGTTLIHYFYHRACELAEDSESIAEAEYRYPGVKPQTREAALVMIGDSIEAASRSLSDPTPARLQGLVNRIISHKFTDTQLEECDLTLRDLHTIAKAFSRVLTSIYHHRVEYPDMLKDLGGKKQHGDSDQKSARRAEGGDAGAAKSPPDHLRRLGL